MDLGVSDEEVKGILNSYGYSKDKIRTNCPSCNDSRKKKNERTFSILNRSDHALYYCHHCGVKGRVNMGSTYEPLMVPKISKVSSSAKVMNIPKSRPLDKNHLDWLKSRGIEKETADKCGVVSGDVYLRSKGTSSPCIGFRYKNSDDTDATKWRDEDKNFTQSGSASSLWRIESFSGGDLVVCEGELDSLSMEQVGVFATSVPNGAPAQKPSPDSSGSRFNYLWESRDAFKKADRVIVAVDNDEPGKFLADEIVRRVGKAKCYSVTYPDGCKDANDVLTKHGEESLRSLIQGATPWPVAGIRDASEFREKAMTLYEEGMDRGLKLDIEGLDNIFRAFPQTLTTFTGVPGSGKSSFLTFLSVNLASKYGWGSVVLSAETPTEIHVLQMASVYLGKSFHGEGKMSEKELAVGLDWVEDNFTFLDESDCDVDSILDRASVAIMRHGARILQIDPYNFLSIDGNHENSVSQINTMLIRLKNWSISHDACCWLVAHPTKQYRGHDGKMPSVDGYSISGSSGFYNTSDGGYSVYRDDSGETRVECWKSRFPWIGSVGDCSLTFDSETGTFGEAPVQIFSGRGYKNGGSIDDFDDF
jgi:twinkle protein